jgi:hypothetical protein
VIWAYAEYIFPSQKTLVANRKDTPFNAHDTLDLFSLFNFFLANIPLPMHTRNGGNDIMLLASSSAFDSKFSYDNKTDTVIDNGESTTDHISNAVGHGVLMFIAW